MKKTVLFAFALLMSISSGFSQKVNFLVNWEPQAQFAGYYVALDKGFYAEAGLEVDMKHWSPNAAGSPLDALSTGMADIATSMLLQGFIETVNNNLDIANIFLSSQRSAMILVSHSDLTNVDLKKVTGSRVGRWKSGFGQEADMLVKKYGINWEWVYFNSGVNLFISKAIDATLCYSFSEFIDLKMAMGDIPENNVVRFANIGYDFPQDALFANRTFLETKRSVVDKFLQASRKGWIYAASHEEETLDIVMKYIKANNYHKNRIQQKLMLEEILKLQINPETGKRDFAPLKASTFNKMKNESSSIGLISGTIKYEDFVR